MVEELGRDGKKDREYAHDCACSLASNKSRRALRDGSVSLSAQTQLGRHFPLLELD